MKSVLLLFVVLIAGCDRTLKPEGEMGRQPLIYPDYIGVTIPCNIAPMNFSVIEEGEFALIIKGKDEEIHLLARHMDFNIPPKRWREILQNNRGGNLQFTILQLNEKKWLAYDSFTMHVAAEPIDSHLVYRMIFPAEQWHKMGIYQRDLTSFEQEPIYENHLTYYNCVNCHTFPANNPNKMIFHMREKESNGTALIEDGKVRKINTKTEQTISNLVYPYWHPEGRYVVASTNSTHKSYYYNSHLRGEVYDTASDVVVWDTERGVIVDNELIASPSHMETFPTFSPDGRKLYYCVADNVNDLVHNIEKLRYSLLAVDFDPIKGSVGDKVDTLYDARVDGRSISMPRPSPDGRHLVVNIMKYGNFSTYHSDSDLYILDLETKELRAIDTINSNESEGYHSWSSNSRWMVFSSRREDRLFTQPYFTYVDNEGYFHKPFVLPQRNPRKFYRDNLSAFNLPELVMDKVEVKPRDIANKMMSEGENLIYAD